MSLQVWLPLNGNLHNQGLNGTVAITQNGTLSTVAGKIGMAYQFGTAANDITISKEAMTKFTTEASFCFWLKILTWNTNYATFFQAGTASAAWAAYRFSLLRNNANSTCCFTISNGSTASNTSYLTPTLELDTWYHIGLIYKTGHCIIYINGQLYRDYTTSIVPDFAGITTIKLGRCTNGSSYQTNCCMNDVRIYDHALSAKEVKEISKGLILHYKLDQNLNVLNNCFSSPTFNTSAAAGGWSHWGPSGHSGTYSQNTDKQFIYNKNNTYSHCVDNTASATGKYYICYQSPAFEGGYRSVQFIVKDAQSRPITESICYPSWNANVSGGAELYKWTRIIDLGNGFYLCQVDGLKQDGSNDLVSIVLPPGEKIYISEGYLENDREICSDILIKNNLDVIYDSSGYDHHAVPTGAIAITSPSIRYGACTHFISDSYLRSVGRPAAILPTDAITVNLWQKSTGWSTPISCAESGGFDFEDGSSISFILYISGTGYVVAKSGVAAWAVNGSWHMITGTYDRQNVKIYIDGELKATTAVATPANIAYANNYLFISADAGGDSTSPASSSYTGDISDVRIYATALSATAIKELYHTSAAVDAKGNVYAREVVEI